MEKMTKTEALEALKQTTERADKINILKGENKNDDIRRYESYEK